MRSFQAMTRIAMAMQISTVYAVAMGGGMTRQRFQASIHTLIDDEMELLLESSNATIDEDASNITSLRGIHRRTLSYNETNNDASNELDDFFESIVSHGWEMALSRSGEHKDSKELFLVCHESPPSLKLDRMQAIFKAFDMSHSDNVFYEPVYSTPEDLCIIIEIPVHVALDWNGSNNSTELTLLPWCDVMKIAPGIIGQLLPDDADLTNATSSYSLVFSIVLNDAVPVDDVLRDVIGLPGGGGGQRRQEAEKHPLHEAFSLSKLASRTSSNASNHYWSRLLEAQDCSSLLNGLGKSPLDGNSVYQLRFEQSTSTESCIVALVVGLAIHPIVSHVGTIADGVELHNIHASWSVQGHQVDSKGNYHFPFTAAGLDGQSQVVSISDTGLDTLNCYFRDSLSTIDSDQVSIFENWNITKRKVLRYATDSNGGDLIDVYKGHGTHVAATIIGSHLNGLGRSKEGIAPQSRAHFFDICTANRCLSPVGQWFYSVKSADPSIKPKVLSASWGTPYLPNYDWTCHSYDKLVADNPDILLISSAGNAGDKSAGGFSTVGAPASCKNVLAVGATINANFGPESSVASFSSRGPTSDGRIKPDVLADGFRLSSAIAGHHNCSQEEPQFLRAGTSMAAPVISGSALLIRQFFEEGFYPCGSRGCGTKIFPSGSLVKAVLLNGAQFQKSIVHAESGIIKSDQSLAPYDNTQGFGAADLLQSLPLQDQNEFGVYVINDEIISLGQEHSFEVVMNLNDSCKSDFSVTLAYYDPPAAVGCTLCLVNDLDLVVEDVLSSTIHYPNGLETPDRHNNAERIRIKNTNLSSGQRYRVTVTATHLGPKYSQQKYSLVSTGCFSTSNVSPMRMPNQSLVTTHSDSEQHELITSYRLMSKRSAAGIVFSIKAKSPGVTVTSFSIRTRILEESSSIYVYKLKSLGRHLNEPQFNNSSHWGMISPPGGFQVNATSSRTLTVLPRDAFRVSIPEGSFQSFYVTFSSEEAILCGRPLNKQQRQKRRDSNIKLDGGIGRSRLFAGRTIDYCFLDGSVVYSVEHTGGILD